MDVGKPGADLAKLQAELQRTAAERDELKKQLASVGDDIRIERKSRSRPSSAPGTSAVCQTPATRFAPSATVKKPIGVRTKRMGYTHVAAVQSSPDMLFDINPDVHYVSAREDAVNSVVSAGVASDRMMELMRVTCKDTAKTPPPNCQLSAKTNLISHSELPDPDDDSPELPDPGAEFQKRGCAGATSDRLTAMSANWIMEKQDDKNFCMNRHKKTDPISHDKGPGPPERGTGIRRCPAKFNNQTSLNHSAVTPPQLSPEAVHQLVMTRIVNMGGGEVLYNVAGGEDLIPPASKMYIKSDRPASHEYRAFNERLLPGFFQWPPKKHPSHCPTLSESEDMYYAMYGDRALYAMIKAQDAKDDVLMAMSSGLRSASFDRIAASGSLTERATEGRKVGKSASVDKLTLFAGFPTARELEERWTARSSSVNGGSPARSPALPQRSASFNSGPPANAPGVLKRSASLNSGSPAMSPARPSALSPAKPRARRSYFACREPGSTQRQRLPAPPE